MEKWLTAAALILNVEKNLGNFCAKLVGRGLQFQINYSFINVTAFVFLVYCFCAHFISINILFGNTINTIPTGEE